MRAASRAINEEEVTYHRFLEAIYRAELADLTVRAKRIADRINTLDIVNAAYGHMWDVGYEPSVMKDLKGDRTAYEVFDRMFAVRKEYALLWTFHLFVDNKPRARETDRRIAQKERRVAEIRRILNGWEGRRP